jgi:lantibiotic modifying enzyme
MIVLLVASPAVAGAAETARRSTEGVHLDRALRAERWLRAQAVVTESGKIWRSPGEKDDHPVTNGNLYYGSAGILLFYLELHQQTGDEAFLQEARDGASYLIATVPKELYIKRDLSFLEIFPSLNLPEGGEMPAFTAANGLGHPNQASLYWGVSGIGFALGEMFRVTGDEQYRTAARKIVDLLLRDKHDDESGMTWGSAPEVMLGDAGVGLFLLYAAEELGHPGAEKAARAVGSSLLARAKESDGGLMWPTGRIYFGTDHPNFSHGTSGVGYFLARLYEHTRDERYLDGARSVGTYLVNIAHDDGLIAHHLPDDGLVYYGWCHGPVGTNRLFEKLAVVSPDERWRSIIERSDRAIMDAELVSREPAGFWENVGQCCGSAGVADRFVALHRETKNPEYLVFARTMSEDIVDHATVDGDSLRWTHVEHRVSPDFTMAMTGYMQGAAGIGMHFLRMHALVNDASLSIRLLDAR